MKLCTLIQRWYGERIVESIIKYGPSSWTIARIELPLTLPSIIDEPEEFLQKSLPECDLFLSLHEHMNAAQLIPDIAQQTRAKAVIVPTDKSNWLPIGLRLQIRREFKDMGISSTFPKPFCTLVEVGNPWIDSFAKHFGRPEVEVVVKDDAIGEVIVKRGAPCGSTWFVAKKLKGTKVKDYRLNSTNFLHSYPCTASMIWDPEVKETLMHVALFGIRKAVGRALRRRYR